MSVPGGGHAEDAARDPEASRALERRARGSDASGEDFLSRYAEVAVRVGANVQPGQPVVVIADVGHVPLVRAVAEAAWRAGAADVEMSYRDPYDRYLLARYAADATLERSPAGETALLESLEGKRGQPRSKPPFPAIAGLYASPTLINNVETIATVPAIVRHGGAWYASKGVEGSAGRVRAIAVS